jgi:transcriptional regulator with XRE-family HTH domain
MGHHSPEHLDADRLDRLRERAGIRSDRQLAIKLGIAPDQIGRWKRGDTVPSGAVVAQLCVLLETTAPFLFGGPEQTIEEQRQGALDAVRRLFGRAEVDALAHMRRLTDHHKSILAGRIVGWVEGLEEYERLESGALPETQFDRDLAQLREQGVTGLGEGETAEPGESEPSHGR